MKDLRKLFLVWLVSFIGCGGTSNHTVPEKKDSVESSSQNENAPGAETQTSTNPTKDLAESGETLKFFMEDGVAIKGADPVAYFTSSQATQGNSAYQYSWQNTTWHFASQENLDLFKADPFKYAPQFGGYCAYAVSRGYTAAIDPDAWRIVDNKLYLNLSLSVRSLWESDVPGSIEKGNQNWPNLQKQL